MDFAAGVLSVWGPLPFYDPILPLPYTLFTCTQYTYSRREGGRGGELTREKVRGTMVHKAGRRYQHDWLYLQSINSIKHQKRRNLGFGVFKVNKSLVLSLLCVWWEGVRQNHGRRNNRTAYWWIIFFIRSLISTLVQFNLFRWAGVYA